MVNPLTAEELAEAKHLLARYDPHIPSSGIVIGPTLLSALIATAERAAAKDALLKLAVDTINGLAEQQAMPDEWYKEPLSKINAALKG
jgi:hypothetical protein